MSGLRVVVAVSRDPSDQYFANQLVERLGAVGVLVETQVPPPDTRPAWRKALNLLVRPDRLVQRIAGAMAMRWRLRYELYNQPEFQADFGEQGTKIIAPPQVSVHYCEGLNAINSPGSIAWLRSMNPDVVVVCGASIIRKEFLSVPRLGVLNLHGGLAQRYRGLNTTDWAVHNGEPEYVGCTVHFVAPGIDDGDILYQGRPQLAADDTPNRLYEKVVKLGVQIMETAVRDLEAGRAKPAKLPSRGDLYLHKHFTPRVRSRTWRRYREGVVRDYLANPRERDAVVDRVIINEYPLSAGYARRAQ
jgi:methionyl-tRNA formyltransferase